MLHFQSVQLLQIFDFSCVFVPLSEIRRKRGMLLDKSYLIHPALNGIMKLAAFTGLCPVEVDDVHNSFSMEFEHLVIDVLFTLYIAM